MKKAFTLIELLVVVLIIGILASIALPQYQKAVEKSKAMTMISLIKPIAQAAELYYINNGTAPTNFDTLDVSLSPEQKEKLACANVRTCENEDFGIELYTNTLNMKGVVVLKTAGKYRGAGFVIFYDNGTDTKQYTRGGLYCYERAQGVNIFNLTRGDYCKKIFGGTLFSSNLNANIFSLP